VRQDNHVIYTKLQSTDLLTSTAMESATDGHLPRHVMMCRDGSHVLALYIRGRLKLTQSVLIHKSANIQQNDFGIDHLQVFAFNVADVHCSSV
jgi:hypothetical protein